MATVREYFEKSFPRVLSAEKAVKASGAGIELTLPVRTHIDTDAFAIYASVLIPDCTDAVLVSVVEKLIANPAIIASLTITPNVKMPASPTDGLLLGFDLLDHKLQVRLEGRDGVCGTDQDCVFTRTIYFYVDRVLPADVRERLVLIALGNNVRLGLRDEAYAETMNKASKPVAFVSHDSRDKEAIVRPLVDELARLDYAVWYDEHSLNVGDNLRRSIEHGLMTTRHCILVLTPNFIAKDGGWPSAELDIAFTREVTDRRQIFLPIWHDVTPDQVKAYSPTLANRVGAQWSKGVKVVAASLVRAIESADSTVHTAPPVGLAGTPGAGAAAMAPKHKRLGDLDQLIDAIEALRVQARDVNIWAQNRASDWRPHEPVYDASTIIRMAPDLMDLVANHDRKVVNRSLRELHENIRLGNALGLARRQEHTGPAQALARACEAVLAPFRRAHAEEER